MRGQTHIYILVCIIFILYIQTPGRSVASARESGPMRLMPCGLWVCHFVDLTLAKGGRWKSTGLLNVGTYHKPTRLNQPLAQHSAHSAHVHLAWPKGMITRTERMCNTRSMFHLEVLHLKRLLAARFGTPYADHILNPIPKQPPSVAFHECLT